MKNRTLSSQILIVSVFTLIVFSVASCGILFRALSNQSTREMDQLLQNEALFLSALVNSAEDEKFDFEMPSNFLNQFKQRNPYGFFRFIEPRSGEALKQSDGAPHVPCLDQSSNSNVEVNGQSYRIETSRFHPEYDREYKAPQSMSPTLTLCLVVGLNRAPYLQVLNETLFASIPIFILIMTLLVFALLMLIRGLTRDLLVLTSALTKADFGATHAFPTLPKAKTQEVKAIIDVLESLHQQVSEVYREMWLFMGRAAHQIKTPVTAMQATLDVLLRKERSKEELLSGLEDVQSAARLLIGLTRKLMLSSKISYEEIPPKETIDLFLFFTDLIELFGSQATMRGAEIVMTEKSSLLVTGNRILMSDLFGNLLENALLYSPAGKANRVAVSWHAIDGKAAIDILDQGPGFPENILRDLFKPFVRGDERETIGSGLGLSIAKKSAKLLYGDIELAESTSNGSRMRVWLPTA